MGGETNSSQVVLSGSSMYTKLVTKGAEKNTEGKRCYMVPLSGLSKVETFLKILLIILDNNFSPANPSSALSSTSRTLMMKQAQIQRTQESSSESDAVSDCVEEQEEENQESQEDLQQPNPVAKVCKAGPSIRKEASQKDAVPAPLPSPRRLSKEASQKDAVPAPLPSPRRLRKEASQKDAVQVPAPLPSPRRLRPRKTVSK
jgi:hypothetical protein